MAFSAVSSGRTTQTGTNTIADLFADAINSPSGNTGTYVDRIGETNSAERTFYTYLIKGLAIDIEGTLNISSSVIFNASVPDKTLNVLSGGVLNAGVAKTDNLLLYNLDVKTNLIFLKLGDTSFNEFDALIYADNGGTANFLGCQIQLSAPFSAIAGSTVAIRNCRFEMYPASNGSDGNLRLRTAGLTIDGLELRGGNFALIETPASLQNYTSVHATRGIGLSNTVSINDTKTVRSYRGLANDYDVELRSSTSQTGLQKVDLINPRTSFFDLTFLATGGLSSQIGICEGNYEYNYTAVNSSNAGINGARLYTIDSNSGNRNSATRNGVGDYSASITNNIVANASGVFSTLKILGGVIARANTSYSGTIDDRRPINVVVAAYGYLLFAEQLNPAASLGSAEPKKATLPTDLFISEANSATVAGYTTKAAVTVDNIYDYSAYDKQTSTGITQPTISTRVAIANGATILNAYGLVVSSSESGIAINHSADTVSVKNLNVGTTFSGITQGANTTVDLVQNGTYATTVIIPATGTVTVADGATNLSTWEFGNGAEINLRSGATAATATVAAGQSANITAGTGVTLVEPSLAVTVTNLIATTRLKIYETGTTTLVDGINSSGTSFAWETGTPGEGYDVYAVLPSYGSVFIENYIYPSGSATLPIAQEIDTNYQATSGLVRSPDGSGLGSTADIYLNTSTKEISAAAGANLLSTTGLSLRDLYSFIIEQRYANDSLMPFHDPIEAVSFAAGEYELRRGWTLLDSTTRNLLRDGGLRVWNSANDTVLQRYINITGLGSLVSAIAPYYWQVDSTTATTTSAVNTGLPNQLVQVYEDGSYDYRDVFRLAVRGQGENYAYYDLIAEQNISQLRSQRYFIPLRTTVDPNITTADVGIDANSDGTADVAPFNGMSLAWLAGTGFTAWANSTVYAANAVVSSAGRWYITTAGGTSSGTGVADDVGVTWAAYSGERQIDGTYYAFNVIGDGNSAGRDRIREFLAWSQRQSVDIDTGSGTRTGKVVTGLYTTQGEDLILGTGVYFDDFDTTDQLSIIPTDVSGTQRPFPAPPATQTIDGIPNVANAIVAVIRHSDDNISYPTITSGSTSYLVDAGDTYTVAIDAPGYLLQVAVLSGAVPSFTASLPDYRSLYESGTNRSDDVLFNYGTLVVTVKDGTPNLSFADIFRTLEDYLATEEGVLFPNPPIPVIVDLGSGVRNYLFFPYDNNLDIVNPVVVKPDPTNTTDPTFTDFVIVLEGSTAPLFDIFDFSAGGGRTIRFQTDAVAANVAVSGDGALTTEQATQLANINTRTENLVKPLIN